MQIFFDGRAPFLEFLRNLTPQAVLLAFIIVASRNLEMTCCNFSNWKNTGIFLSLILIWLASVWANSSIFFEKYLVSLPKIEEESKRLLKLKISRRKHFVAFYQFCWSGHKSLIVEFIFVFVVIEWSLVVTVLHAIPMAMAFPKQL